MTAPLPKILHRSSPRRRRPLGLALWTLLGCSGQLDVSREILGMDGGGEGTDTHSESVAPFDAGVPRATCQDGTRNGDESDIDCGGLDCPACAAEFSCARHDDCNSGQCRAGRCIAPSCNDGIQNGSETAVDCGGSACARCRTNTCNCAISPVLSALTCDETLGYRQDRGVLDFLTPDGQAALYSSCYLTNDMSSVLTCRTFRWTNADGLELIGDGHAIGLSSDGQRSLYQSATNGDLLLHGAAAEDVVVPLNASTARLSADGSRVLGVGQNTGGAYELTRWTLASGLEPLGELPVADGSGSKVHALTADASVVVGVASAGTVDVPFRWTAAGIVSLGPIPPNATGARPLALSNDGAVVAGVTSRSSSPVDIFRWTENDGLSILGPTTEYQHGAEVFLSADGSVVGGSVGIDINPWRYSTTEGAQLLLSEWGVVQDMNANGSIIVGVADPGFIWTPLGATNISDLVVARGANLDGWEIGEPYEVADDGSFVFGRGTCGGVPVTYRLVLTD